MSKNLGPIHYLMYEKIKFQDKITNYLMDGDTSKIDKEIKPVSTENLEDIIDQDNIHGYLSSKIDVVENRLALAFSKADNIKEKMFELGKKEALDENLKTLEDVYNSLNTRLLDGMPCDHAQTAAFDNDNDLLLITNENLHRKYQDTYINPASSLDETCKGEGDHDHHDSFELKKFNYDNALKSEDSIYHDYRYEFIRGFLDNTEFKVEQINGINYKISKI